MYCIVLEKDKSVTIHEKHLQLLATEMYKILNGLSPKIINDIFPLKENSIKLRSNNKFKTFNVKSVYFGTETITFRCPKTWALIPNEIKISRSLPEFRKKINYGKWKLARYSCPLKYRWAQPEYNEITKKYQFPYQIKYYANGSANMQYQIGQISPRFHLLSLIHQNFYELVEIKLSF